MLAKPRYQWFGSPSNSRTCYIRLCCSRYPDRILQHHFLSDEYGPRSCHHAPSRGHTNSNAKGIRMLQMTARPGMSINHFTFKWVWCASPSYELWSDDVANYGFICYQRRVWDCLTKLDQFLRWIWQVWRSFHAWFQQLSPSFHIGSCQMSSTIHHAFILRNHNTFSIACP